MYWRRSLTYLNNQQIDDALGGTDHCHVHDHVAIGMGLTLSVCSPIRTGSSKASEVPNLWEYEEEERMKFDSGQCEAVVRVLSMRSTVTRFRAAMGRNIAIMCVAAVTAQCSSH